MKPFFFRLAASFSLIFILCGCTSAIQKGRRADSEKIKDLSQKVDELSNARSILEERLAKEISDKTVKLDMMEKGLVVTFVADILFDSGKAKLRPEADASLDKVSRVIVENVPDRPIGIEGHTDNEPIQASGWKSNWELSVARALSVLHYLQDDKNVDPKRLCVTGYGQERPVADNSARDGRQMNRRVEIVIMPKAFQVK
ncbi:MAG: flagellar motor protein MotB [Candidatus Omnitrophica bacterium]|jgi:chemotaxis protein MotB|nr:flagellar motor protein MotB [Candidatus Omnitrophota bacterium]